MQRTLVESFEKNCPARAMKNTRSTPWLNPGFQDLIRAARRVCNKTRNIGRPSDCPSHYKRAQKKYRFYNQGEEGKFEEILRISSGDPGSCKTMQNFGEKT